MELSVVGVVYSCTFFKKTNSQLFFHVTEDCQYDFFFTVESFPIRLGL